MNIYVALPVIWFAIVLIYGAYRAIYDTAHERGFDLGKSMADKQYLIFKDSGIGCFDVICPLGSESMLADLKQAIPEPKIENDGIRNPLFMSSWI